MTVQVAAHVLYVVDTSSQLTALAEIVDADQESLTATRAIRVLKGIAAGSAVAECLGLRWWRRRGVVISLDISIVVGRREGWTGTWIGLGSMLSAVRLLRRRTLLITAVCRSWRRGAVSVRLRGV
jgi:hypothetical protein